MFVLDSQGLNRGDEDVERFRRRGRRTVSETRMEDGNVYGVIGAHHVKPCGTTI